MRAGRTNHYRSDNIKYIHNNLTAFTIASLFHIIQRTMRQTYTQLIEIEHAYRHINSNAQMLTAAGNTDLAADIKAQSLGFHLL